MHRSIRSAIVFLLSALLLPPALPARAAGATYYVAAAPTGSDSNPGTSEAAPFASIAKVNALALRPGDRVLFRCGDTWRGEMLRLEESGAAGSPITIGAYPAGCANRPVISGALPVAGWAPHAAGIYVADLGAGPNAGKFPNGINQLFRGEQRLPLGRWPNLDDPASDKGYASIDSHSGAQITDAQLPSASWAGAVAHIKAMRWFILNRQVTTRSGATLTLNANVSCYAGGCAQWGYWLSNHLATLDREGEWFYDAATRKVYLFTAAAPGDGEVEGSAVLQTDSRAWGGITLGKDMQHEAAYITVENLAIVRWHRHGIATPTNYENFEAHHLIIRNNLIRDVDRSGINLATWVYSPDDGRPAGWRGGYSLEVTGNTIERANRYGVLLYSRDSLFSGNTLRDIALIENLGAGGMGCDYDDGEGACTQDGVGFMVYAGNPDDSGNRNIFEYNRLERIGHNGWLIFSHGNTLRYNVIQEACWAKGDCAGIRPFGDGNKAAGAADNPVRDTLIQQNVIVDTLGNTDGAHPTYKERFGFGINADYSSAVTATGNVVINTTAYGILYKKSTGAISGNVLYNNGRSSERAQLSIGESSRASVNGNVLFALNRKAQTISIEALASLTAADANYLFNPYRADHTVIADGGGRKTFAQWQSATGKDASSRASWYTQSEGDPPLSAIFYNDSAETKTVELGSKKYLNLDQQTVQGSFTLAPFSARVLVFSGEAALTPELGLIDPGGPPVVFTLRNITQAPLAITGISVGAGFAQTHNCPPSLDPGATCTISVTFTGSPGQPVEGTLQVAHGAGAPYTARLIGAPAQLRLPLIRR